MNGGGPTARDFAFPKSERIRKRSEIDRVFKTGTRFSVRGMRLHVVPNGTEENRVVFVPVRHYANAVKRNRAKRLAREAYRLTRAGQMGKDLVFVIYPGFDVFADRKAQMSRLLGLAGVPVTFDGGPS